ncbi:PREDICTED: uncharacterized protein LOC107188143 [Dufourea novaeangliae]|uniref:Uncharacterized protein n=1 Tax=Dufourea novaeangliae TaxID=178035 RepID=A0A154PDU6_DUFNO|nr:PREDICTED: uncharacterized protein LOC107188143 [Dufourea novaeangliae]KZC10011.1 hypothetical protein WN55_01744 [Dufourea novaeangliae]
MCHATWDWMAVLPVVLWGLRTAYKEDLRASSAELVYGATLKVPAEFLDSEELDSNPQIFVQEFRRQMREIRPVPVAHHIRNRPFQYKDLYSCSHVFLQVDSLRGALEQPYSGPHRVIDRISDRVFRIDLDDRNEQVSVERLKPAYIAVELDDQPAASPGGECSETPSLRKGVIKVYPEQAKNTADFQCS